MVLVLLFILSVCVLVPLLMRVYMCQGVFHAHFDNSVRSLMIFSYADDFHMNELAIL